MSSPVVVIAESGGAIARSARRAGYEPFVIDTLGTSGDPGATCPAARFPFGVQDLIGQAPGGVPVLLGSPMENHPDLVETLTRDRPLIGAPVAAIRKVRHPYALSSLPPFKGLKLCKTRTRASFTRRLARLAFGTMGKKFLLKPRFESGGRGIDWWSPTARIDDAHYLQQFIKGTPMSAVFHADGWSCRFLGLTEMAVGESGMGASAFAWCRSVGPIKPSKKAKAALEHLGVVLTQRHDLRGAFGVDLVMDWRGNLWPVEVNPRYTESMAVLERATGRSVLVPGGPEDAKRSANTPMQGKAAIFAQRDGVVGALPEGCQDALPSGARYTVGDRVCCVVAQGPSQRACEAALQERVNTVYAALHAKDPQDTQRCVYEKESAAR